VTEGAEDVHPRGRARLIRPLLVRLRRGRLGIRLTRYTAGSVIATLLGQVTFVGLYGLDVAGPQVASAVAWVAGAVPNYLINRAWAWERRGRARLRAEVLPYVAVILTTGLLATVTTTLVDRYVHLITGVHAAQVVIVDAAFVSTYGVMFVVKFLLFERLVFRDPTPP
jgi:putative flippase GtrA